MLLWLAIVSQLSAAPLPPDSTSGIHRYALIISSNRGNIEDPLLRYAETDGQEVAQVLTDMGSFQSRDVVTVASAQARDVREAFLGLRRRIDREHSAQGSLLLVYYSGHADAENMHLGGTLLNWHDMMELTHGAHADLSLLVVDACRSGQLTRGKGARYERPFSLPTDENELPHGIAIMTSASAGENAQESPTLRGSFFTHHFVAGLRGAADLNADGKVTLNEAFSYSSEQSAGDTAQTMIGVQHATYHFHLTGRMELGLTTPARSPNISSVRIDAPGNYVFRQPDGGPVVLQTQIRNGSTRTVWLPEGRYAVQRRLPDSLSEGEVQVRHARTARLNVATLAPQEYAMVSAKGGDVNDTLELPKSPVFTLAAMALGGAAPLQDFSGSFGPQLVGSLTLGHGGGTWMLDMQLGTTHSGSSHPTLSISEWDTNAAVGVRDVFLSARYLELSAGLHGGASFATQTYTGSAATAARSQVSPLAEGLLRVDILLPNNWFITAQGVIRTTWINREQVSGATERAWVWQPMAALGGGFVW